MKGIKIKKVDNFNVDLINLIKMLDIELLQQYPEEGIFGLDINSPEINKTTSFVVVYYNNVSVACAAIRQISTNCIELKRFFVVKELRRRGIATKLLLYLESEAKLRGFKSVRLETGPYQPESIEFYKKLGYISIENFGEYTNSIYSICMEKKL